MSAVTEIMEQDSIQSSEAGIRQTKIDFVMHPAPFQEGDDRWKDMFDIKRYNKHVHLYIDGATKRTLYGITRRDYEVDGASQKDIFPFYYDEVLDTFVKGNPYNKATRLYNEHKFPKFDSTAPRSLMFVEGEVTCDAAQKLFPMMMCTTASGGVQNIQNINDISVVSGFHEIVFWSDNDIEGQTAFEEIANQIQDFFPDIAVKMVDVPRKKIPRKWDLANYKPSDEINIHELVRNAPLVKDRGSFTNLQRDIENDRFIYIKPQNCFYDTLLKDESVTEKVINNLFRRDRNAGGQASRRLQDAGCEVASGYTFKVGVDDIVKVGKTKYINTYTPVIFDKIEGDELKALENDPEILLMLGHLNRAVSQDEILNKHFLCTIAHGIQHPEQNRIWGTLICSKQGWGKSWIGNLLTALNGEANTKWLDQEDVFDRFREWLPSCNMVVIDELRWNKATQGIFVSKMKTLITQTRHRMEEKNKGKLDYYGHYNFWVFSNNFIPFDIDEEERRWHIIWIKENKAALLQAMGQDYFSKLHALLGTDDKPNKTFLKKAYNFFKNYKIDYNIFNLHKCPETQAKEDLKKLSWGQNDRDLNDLYEEGKAPFDRRMFSAESVLKKIRILQSDISQPHYRNMFRGMEVPEITAFFRDRMQWGKVWKGNTVQLHPDPVRRNYWSPDDEWIGCTDLSLMREHMKSGNPNLNPNQKILNFKDKKNDDQNRAEGVSDDPF